MEKISRVVTLEKGGQIKLPPQILENEKLKIGDKLDMTDMAGVIMIRKLHPKPTVVDLLSDLGRTLNKKGYNTKEKVNALINEVKLEVMDEWEERVKKQLK